MTGRDGESGLVRARRKLRNLRDSPDIVENPLTQAATILDLAMVVVGAVFIAVGGLGLAAVGAIAVAIGTLDLFARWWWA